MVHNISQLDTDGMMSVEGIRKRVLAFAACRSGKSPAYNVSHVLVLQTPVLAVLVIADHTAEYVGQLPAIILHKDIVRATVRNRHITIRKTFSILIFTHLSL